MINFKVSQNIPIVNPTTISPKPSNNIPLINIVWTNSIDSTYFVLSLSSNSRKKRQASVTPIYIAFGLSTDQEMGNDDVAVCQLNSDGTVHLYHYFNNGKSSGLLSSTDPVVGFSSIITSVTNGNPTCSFTRAKTMSSVSNYFDANNKYYIITASGSVSSSGILVSLCIIKY